MFVITILFMMIKKLKYKMTDMPTKYKYHIYSCTNATDSVVFHIYV